MRNQPGQEGQIAAGSPPALMIGLVMMALGGWFVAMATGHAPLDPDQLNGPRFVLTEAGLIFLLGGGLAAGGPRLPAWVSGLGGALIFTLFALIASWIAWGSGPRAFGGNGMGLARMFHWDTALTGRVAFGIGALVCWLGSAAAWFAWLSRLDASWRAAAITCAGALGWWAFWLPAQAPDLSGISDPHARLGAYYALKGANPDWGGGRRARREVQDWVREEAWVKQARADLAAARQASAPVLAVPRTAPPRVDGVLDDGAWQSALELPLAQAGDETRILVASDGQRLYIAADVPPDTTADGYDQLRFHYHLDLSPYLREERIHVDRSGSVTAIRDARIPASTDAAVPEPDQDSLKRVSDWHVLADTQGAATLDGHRRFEASISLAEAGIALGVPVQVSAEVEGDPLKTEAGKFKARVLHAQTARRGLWIVIEKP